MVPRWKCHKEVQAFKIVSIEPQGKGAQLLGSDCGVLVNSQYMARHEPVNGGYYVLYADGYESFSPAAAFESGYTRIDP